jgi:fibronectin type 3 domain-containing protein
MQPLGLFSKPTLPVSELTYEENLGNIPPPPAQVKAAGSVDGIKLTWQPPAAVTVTHHYSDVILHYVIYRRTAETGMTFLAKTAELEYSDKSAVPGVVYFYGVTDVREDNNESGRSDEVSATRP